ncbi:MBOAT family protein [Pseudodesulfovibrio sp. zrk46]|uniref:MBOAT family O-acyltransferase n=1 Tax=Pseudodesulfovibrio sp. zrk46 TaxID=2725288 RepID=UPI0014498390|nr:MBOAT family protein [Pseudodesulfovibrio sp. zrk46]QJB56595.1 MBOAT family protein [Pseudodesulfovibrio sp. zrk46]
MLFSQIEFFIFFVLVLTFLGVVKNNTTRKVFLLGASYYFYSYWDYRFLSLILISTLVDFCVGLGLEKYRDALTRRVLLIVSISVNLGLLVFFKYYNFFIDSFAPAFQMIGLHPGTLDIILPVGISFYTFQTLSYSIDVYRGRLKTTKSLLDFALFVSFFPQLVAGPIVRASHFLPQLEEARSTRWDDFYQGARQFVFGLGKKVLIADRLATFVDPVFASPELYSSGTLWLAAASYSLQIYFDFSGYSDMAIGVARCMGYDLGKNFNFPYLSRSLSEFWQRWHISLSSWVRDYLYIPLGGSRCGLARNCFNLMLTMVVMGAWHGAAWTFVAWGALHGFGQVAARLKMAIVGRNEGEVGGGVKLANWAGTMLFVLVGWILFRAETFGHAKVMVERMLVLSDGVRWMPAFAIYAIIGTAVIHLVELSGRMSWFFLKEEKWYAPALLLSIVWAVILFQPKGFSPFIYFQF